MGSFFQIYVCILTHIYLPTYVHCAYMLDAHQLKQDADSYARVTETHTHEAQIFFTRSILH